MKFSWKKSLFQGAGIGLAVAAAGLAYLAWLWLKEKPEDFQYRDSSFVVVHGNPVVWVAAALAVLAGIAVLFAGVRWALWRMSEQRRLNSDCHPADLASSVRPESDFKQEICPCKPFL